MSVFVLLGMTGLYARQMEAAGWLGLAGYLLWSLFWVLALLSRLLASSGTVTWMEVALT
jgi:hypothetical protein